GRAFSASDRSKNGDLARAGPLAVVVELEGRLAPVSPGILLLQPMSEVQSRRIVSLSRGQRRHADAGCKALALRAARVGEGQRLQSARALASVGRLQPSSYLAQRASPRGQQSGQFIQDELLGRPLPRAHQV